MRHRSVISPRLLAILYFLVLPSFLAAQGKPDYSTPPPNAKYVPGRLLVRFKASRSLSVRPTAHAVVGARVVMQFKHVNALEMVELPETKSIVQALASYRQNPDVLYAEPDYILHTHDTQPDDPMFDYLWGLRNIGQQNGLPGADIGATKAWDLTTGSSSVIVGDLDTGIDYTHPDLAPNLLPGVFFAGDELYDYVGHGTHTAGTIGAVGNNGMGVSGVNWNVKIAPCKFMTAGAGGTVSGAIQCLDYIASLKDQGMNVIATNNSWGGGAYSQALYDAIRAQLDRGILFIASAGNDGHDNDIYPSYPNSYDLPNIISVAATDRRDHLAIFSNFGLHTVDVGAPGVGVVSTYPGGDYQSMDGTSMAAPHVTGVAALLKAYSPGLDWRGIKNRILAGGDVVTSLGATVTKSRLNAYGALTCTNRPVMARLEPRHDMVTTAAGAHVPISVLNINCDQPAGDVIVTVDPTGDSLRLVDNGTAADRKSGDGVYSADFIAPESGTYLLHFPNGDSVQVRVLTAYQGETIPFQYRTITGQSLLLDDDEARAVDLPFAIRFGGQQFDRLYVSSNGLVTFDFAYASGYAYPLPWPTLGTVVAPMWDDFVPFFDGTHNVYWAVNGTAPSRELVVEWRDLGIFTWDPVPPASGATFQVVFFEDRDDVLFSYKDADTEGVSQGTTMGIQVGPTAGTIYRAGTGMTTHWTPAVRDLTLSLPSIQKTVFVGTGGATFETVTKSLYGLSSPVTISCTAGAPQTCVGDTFIPSPDGTTTNVHADDATPGEYRFGIRADAVGLPITHEQQVILDVMDLNLGPASPAELTLEDGGTAEFNLQVSASGQLGISANLSCSGIAGGTCTFSPAATLTLTPGVAASVRVTLTLSPKTAPGSYNLVVQGSSSAASRTLVVPIHVVGKADFFLQPSTYAVAATSAEPTLVGVNVDQQDGYSGIVQLQCSVIPTGPSCTATPATITSFPTNTAIAISQNNAPVGMYSVTITGADGIRTKTASVSYRIADYMLTGPASVEIYRASGRAFYDSLSWNGQQSRTLDFQCSVPSPATCYIGQAHITAVSPVTISVYADSLGPIAPFPLQLRVLEDGMVVAALTTQVISKGFTLVAGPRSEHTVLAGQVSEPFDLTFIPWGGYELPTSIELWTCDFCSPTQFTVVPNGSPAVVTFTALPPPTATQWAFGDVQFAAISSAVTPDNTMLHISTSDAGFTVHVKDFWVAADRDLIAVVPGQSSRIQINSGAKNGLDVPIRLACPTDIGDGLSCSLTKDVVNPGESTVLTITATSTAPASYRSMQVSANATVGGSEVTRIAPLRMDVGRFTFPVFTPTLTVRKGGGGYFQVQSGFNGSDLVPNLFDADLSCVSLDPGVTCEAPLHITIPGYISVAARTDALITSVGAHPITLHVSVGGEQYDIPLTIVMQGNDSVLLTTPNGFERWEGGIHNITWSYEGDPGSTVRLELWNHDVFDSVIADNVPIGSEGKGYYAWSIPDSLLFSAWYRVRIVSTAKPEISDASDIRVWVGRGGEIINFVGGSTFYADVNPPIDIIYYTWLGFLGWRFDLYQGNKFISTLTTGDSGCFKGRPDCLYAAFLSWPSDLPDGDYTLRMVPLADESRASWNSGGNFKVVRAGLTVSSPAQGDIFKPGDTIAIGWTFRNLPETDLGLALNSGDGFPSLTIVRSIPAGQGGTGTYSWTIPSDLPPSMSYSVSLQTYAVPTFTAVSGGFAVGTFYRLVVDASGPGSIATSDYLLSCPNSCSGIYSPGKQITLIPTANVGSIFAGWTGACSGTGTCLVTMDSDKSVSAIFVTPDFALTSGSQAISTPSGGSANLSLQVKSINGLGSAVVLSCSNLPIYSRCAVSDNNPIPDSPGKAVSLTIFTSNASAQSQAQLMMLFVPGIGLLIARMARRSRRMLLPIVMALVIGAGISCGGGGSNAGVGQPPVQRNTPPGTYRITINASSGSIQHSLDVTLTVQ